MPEVTMTFQDEIVLPIPNGAHVLDEAEMAALPKLAGGECTFLRDEARHSLISVGRKPLGMLTAAFVDLPGLAKRLEQGIAEPMASYEYRYGGPQSVTFDGQEAKGLSYHYKAQEIAMYGESYVLKNKKVIWYLHLYAREDSLEESLAVWRTFLSQIEWKK